MAQCSLSYLGLLQYVQEMEEVYKGQWRLTDEFGQQQLLTGQHVRGSLENFSLKTINKLLGASANIPAAGHCHSGVFKQAAGFLLWDPLVPPCDSSEHCSLVLVCW